jgi:hypothetical protein
MEKARAILKRVNDPVRSNAQDGLAGDPEVMVALLGVEHISADERASGAVAFHVDAGKPSKRLEQFDQQARQIMLVPRVVGGYTWKQ